MRPALLFLATLCALSAAPAKAPANYDRAADQHDFTVFMREGGWCWFQDPRATIHNGNVFLGSVQGNETGPARVGVYSLKDHRQVGSVTMLDGFDRDDHNSPVFHVRPDGSVLAVYARHGRDRIHHYRISDPKNPLKWSSPMTYRHDYPNSGTVTYMNLHALKNEERLYNFFRGIEFNPCFITSLDHGKTWGNPTHFIKSELKGRHRPYTRYAGNGKDTIHVSFTDGHPDRYGNSIYYAAFRDEKFHRADGEVIKDLKADGPLRPSESELIFKGSNVWAPPGRASAPRSAWTSSIALDTKGRPHIAYSLHLTNEDHRYRIASWNGKKWNDREVAFAGHCLYDTQTSYTGLITLDPQEPATVVISTNVDPNIGKKTGGKHEIYRARIAANDSTKSVRWKAITKHSPVRNIRPVILRADNTRIIAWLRGEFISYYNYQLDVVGLVESVK